MSKEGAIRRYEKVMIVDDDKVDLYISAKVIHAANFAEDVVLQRSIRNALNYLVDAINNSVKLPDLIFLDWNFPGESSVDFLREAKTLFKAANAETTILILTNLLNTDFVMKRIEMEYPMVQAFLEKPLTEEILAAI